MFRRLVISTVVVAALASAAAALAGNGGYRMYVAAQHRPATGSVYSVTIHGRAPQRVLVYVYLDNQACRASWKSEDSQNVSAFKAGQSYFQKTGKALLTAWVGPGQFDIAYNAHAGSEAQPEYACAYMTTPSANGGAYRTTMAHRSNAYFVTG
ncbi:MAG TPA: hypothetical protein VFA37_09660 [Gaiellaceae bacterium]|nr:hypothetical protein [Gaiellaceae bacterium]